MEANPDEIRTPTQFVSLQEISKTSSISYQTLSYYTSLGLLTPQKRQGNKRLYIITEVKERLAKIARFKNEGYPLRVISNILNNHKQDMQDELF